MEVSQKMLDNINKSEKYKTYSTGYEAFKKAFVDFMKRLVTKLNTLTTKTVSFSTEAAELTMKDNTVFKYTGNTGVSKLTIKYPEGDFISTILFSTAKSGTITANFPKGSTFVGRKKLEFFPKETWEINIHNKRIVAVQIFDNE